MNIAILSPFPGKNLAGAQEMSAVAKYTLKLIQNVCKSCSQPNNIDIYANQLLDSGSIEEKADLQQQAYCIAKVYRPMKGKWSFLALIKRIRAGKYDVVHIQHETFLYGGPISILLFPIFVLFVRAFSPVIVTLHHIIEPKQIDKTFAILHRSKIPSILIKLGYAIFYRMTGFAASCISVHDNSDKAILCKNYGVIMEKVAVIPHGSENLSEIVKDSREELIKYFGISGNVSKIFGFFAYIDESKGLDYLISEFTEYSKKHPESALIIAGSLHPAYKRDSNFIEFIHRLHSQIEQNPQCNIRWYGSLHPNDEGRFYKLVDCIILPYKDFNGGSASLSHAIGNGTPFLVSEKFKRLVPKEALCFSLRQNSLKDKLNEYSDSDSSLATNARSYSEELMRKQTWKIVANQYIQLYRSLLRQTQVHRTLIIGAYGQNNLGDEILLNQCLSFLRKEDCIVASAQPSQTEQKFEVATIHSQHHPLRKLLAFLHAKTIVVGGGDQFKIFKKSVGRFHYALIVQFFLIAVLARLLGKKLYFIGIGIGNVSSFFAGMLTRWTIRLATFSTFRDANSFDFVQRNIPDACAALSTDLAFLEPITDREPILPKQDNDKHTLGIAPVFNIDQEEVYPFVIRQTGAAVDGFLGEKPQNRAIFLPFQTGFNKHHDSITSQEILAHTNQGHRCTIDEALNTASVSNVYRSLDFLWGMRLHSLILACIHAVPFIALVYDVKVKNFLEEIDYSDWSIPLDVSFSAERLLALQKGLEEHAEEIRYHLQSQTQKLHRKALINAEVLRCIQEGRPIELHKESERLSDFSQEGCALPTLSSPLPHHHSLRQPQWKK